MDVYLSLLCNKIVIKCLSPSLLNCVCFVPLVYAENRTLPDGIVNQFLFIYHFSTSNFVIKFVNFS